MKYGKLFLHLILDALPFHCPLFYECPEIIPTRSWTVLSFISFSVRENQI